MFTEGYEEAGTRARRHTGSRANAARLLGELHEAPQVNLVVLPEWRQIRVLIVEALQASGRARPDLVVSANPGCLMQLASGLKRAGRRVPVLHMIEIALRVKGLPAPQHLRELRDEDEAGAIAFSMQGCKLGGVSDRTIIGFFRQSRC